MFSFILFYFLFFYFLWIFKLLHLRIKIYRISEKNALSWEGIKSFVSLIENAFIFSTVGFKIVFIYIYTCKYRYFCFWREEDECEMFTLFKYIFIYRKIFVFSFFVKFKTKTMFGGIIKYIFSFFIYFYITLNTFNKIFRKFGFLL